MTSSPTLGFQLIRSVNLTLFGRAIVTGLIALGLNLGVAVIAAMNAALASYHSSTQAESQAAPKLPRMRYSVLFCICGQVGAAVLTGVTLFLMSVEYDPIAGLVAGGFYVVCLLITAYYILQSWGWKADMRTAPLVVWASVLTSTVAFGLAMAHRWLDAYIISCAFAVTLVFHLMVIVLKPIQLSSIIVPAVLLCGLWAASIYVGLATRIFLDAVVISRCIACATEAFLLAAIALRAFTRNRGFFTWRFWS